MSDNGHADGAHDAEADPGELAVAAVIERVGWCGRSARPAVDR
jgi:hypothetical protein